RDRGRSCWTSTKRPSTTPRINSTAPRTAWPSRARPGTPGFSGARRPRFPASPISSRPSGASAGGLPGSRTATPPSSATPRALIVGDATRANLRGHGLLADADRFCLQEPERTKAVRRAELVSGKGSCAWSGTPVTVLAFVGDQMGDFPAADEHIADTGTDDAFGRTCFLLPNSMYGEWTTKVTRRR